MKRRQFIKISTCTGLALALMPDLIYASQHQLTSNELIGKGKPDLYGNGHALRKEAHEAFMQMRNAAKLEGIVIHSISSYRSFKRQKEIWERKYLTNLSRGLTPLKCINKIVEYSTIPGTSRHHWGTDIDIVDGNFLDTPALLSEKNFNKEQPFHKLKIWLEKNANSFGYYLVYTNDPNRKGFKYEPWHYSYKPLSVHYLKQYHDINIRDVLRMENFKGAEHLSNTFMNSYYNEHIMDINPKLIV